MEQDKHRFPNVANAHPLAAILSSTNEIVMHYKSKIKLRAATKLYTIEPEEDKATILRIQLPTREYVEVRLNLPFPKTVSYISLAHGGFNYDPIQDTPITHNPSYEVIRILQNSINYRSNNTDTINKLILLIGEMSPYI